MRVFTVSDLHIDYVENRQWVYHLSTQDYQQDILILAGDISDKLPLLRQCFEWLVEKFYLVMFVPGNHDLWVSNRENINSQQKYQQICQLADECGVLRQPFHGPHLTIVPLLSWYDFSFAEPCEKLLQMWMDFRRCVWAGLDEPIDITRYFLAKNQDYLTIAKPSVEHTLISFSHFLPRIDLMPATIPATYHYIYPALGSDLLEQQVRQLMPDIHIYGHSHVNRNIEVDGINYINNAFGYPSEQRISHKRLQCIHQC